MSGVRDSFTAGAGVGTPERSDAKNIGYIDFLKVVGLIGIFIAHANPPSWALMLRCFDVPLMVILSAMLGERSWSRCPGSPSDLKVYYLRRVKRIVLPTWIFLAVYFPLSLLLGREPQPVSHYVYSVLMTRYGMDYVWIMLIYLYVSLLVPLFSRQKDRVASLLAVAALYVLYEIAVARGVGRNNRWIDATLYYSIPYGALTWLGCRERRMTSRGLALTAAAGLAVFAALAVYFRMSRGQLISPQNFKYPPRIYFLSYGVGCSFALLWLCRRFAPGLYGHPLIRFISRHSMWIYLWQILFLDVYAFLKLPEIWYVKAMVVFAVSVLMTASVGLLLNALEKRKPRRWIKYLR